MSVLRVNLENTKLKIRILTHILEINFMVEDKNTPVISSQFVLSTGILYIKLIKRVENQGVVRMKYEHESLVLINSFVIYVSARSSRRQNRKWKRVYPI